MGVDATVSRILSIRDELLEKRPEFSDFNEVARQINAFPLILTNLKSSIIFYLKAPFSLRSQKRLGDLRPL